MVSTLEPRQARGRAPQQAAPARPQLRQSARGVNLSGLERWLSLVGGGLLAVEGLREQSARGLLLAGLGGALLYRGASGRCEVYRTLGIHTAAAGKHGGVSGHRGVKVTEGVTINRPADELYRAWRNFAGLPRFMKHLVSVEEQGNRSRWVAWAPAGGQVSWTAEIIKEDPGRLIAWQSLPGATVATAGSVHFTPGPVGRGTEVRVTLKYDPPGGRVGAWLAWLFGEEPSIQVREDLARFKQLMEAGEIATVQGQTSCRC